MLPRSRSRRGHATAAMGGLVGGIALTFAAAGGVRTLPQDIPAYRATRAPASAPHLETTRYTIDLKLDPGAAHLEAEVHVDIATPADGEPLEFLLHSDLEVEAVTGPRVRDVQVVPGHDPVGMPESRLTLVTVHTEPTGRAGVETDTIPSSPGDPVRVTFRYAGWIASERVQFGADGLHPDWVELDIGSMWLPMRATLAETFTYRARVTVPEGFEVIGSGTRGRDEAVWTFETTEPHAAASVAVAPNMRTTTIPGDVEVILHNPGNAPDVEGLASKSARAVELFVNRFGPIAAADGIQIVLPPDRRARPEGYSRDRYVMIVHGMDAGEQRFSVAAHEIAHLWWHGAPTQAPSNFFNESFAEYSAWLAVEDHFGADAFEAQLQAARADASGVGSIRDWTPATNGALVYRRGPVLLHDLRNRMGDKAFGSLLRIAHQRGVSDIETFAAMVAERSDAETARWLVREF